MDNAESRIETFVARVQSYIAERSLPDSEARRAADSIFESIKEDRQPLASLAPARLPVCDLIHEALDVVAKGTRDIAGIGEAFADIEPMLRWHTIEGSHKLDAAFAQGHADAIVVGPGGLLWNGRAQIGVTLMAPNVSFPNHRHRPEEVYVILSSGEWRRKNDGWFSPGIGTLVYNQAGIMHAMRSTHRPLFAVWCLWEVAETTGNHGYA